MEKLKRIEIKGYKSIKDASIDLGDLNVLIGANGSGKSNLLSAFELADEVFSHSSSSYIEKQGGAGRLLHHGSRRTKAAKFNFAFEHFDYGIDFEFAIGDNLVAEAIRRGQVVPLEEWAADDLPWPTVDGTPVFHFQDTSSSAPSKALQKVDDDRSLRADASNLAPVLHRIGEADSRAYQEILRRVRAVAPFFKDFDLRPSSRNEQLIRLEWRHKDSDAYFDGYSLSDGTLRFICLTTLLLQPPEDLPPIILIDEPELGLHPFAIQLVAEMLTYASTYRTVIVATQSVTLLDWLEPKNVIVVEQTNGESSFKRLEAEKLEQWLEDFSLGELWQKNVLGGQP